jgi:predicted Rossmann fold flavoprotein
MQSQIKLFVSLHMHSQHFKIGIIVGGAEGLMSAISAGEAGCKSIALFEGNVRCGTKILMSGGTRCNVTNKSVTPKHFFGGNRNFIKNVLSAFNDQRTIQFFKSIGVELKLEPTGKYFPVDNEAKSVLNALTKKANEYNVQIFHSTKINDIKFDGNKFELYSDGKKYYCNKVIITTGGKSYPTTGSDGSGYGLAKKFGHSVTLLFPALSPILLNEPKLKELSGITIPAELTLLLVNKKHISFSDSLLFTHFGISGPAALNISREVERLKSENIKLVLNVLPQFNFEKFHDELKTQKQTNPDKTAFGYLKQFLPERLCKALFDLVVVCTDKKFNHISNNEINTLTGCFTNYTLKFSGVKGFGQAEATAGGIPLDEVKYQTMESKLQQGLFFAGEILDVDGLLGGYNFQWAWSSGYVAGKAAASNT